MEILCLKGLGLIDIYSILKMSKFFADKNALSDSESSSSEEETEKKALEKAMDKTTTKGA